MYYVAYGANMNVSHMEERCPSTRPLCVATLPGCRLEFRRYATIVPCAHGAVPAVLWHIADPADLRALDEYEDYPDEYRREQMTVTVPREQFGTSHVQATVYIMNGGKPEPPASEYLAMIAQGYRDFGLDAAPLREAAGRAARREEAAD